MNNIHALLQRKIQQVEVPQSQEPKKGHEVNALKQTSQGPQAPQLEMDSHTQEFLDLMNKALKEINTSFDLIDEKKIGAIQKELLSGVYKNPAFLDAFEHELPIR